MADCDRALGVCGAPDSYIVWPSDRPGDLVRGRLLPLMSTGVVLTSILFGFVIVYLRWLTQDLEASQAQSKELLGRDPLSGLANRLLFGERLDAALAALGETGDGLAVLFIDLDRFKDVNDTLGHLIGDELLREIGNRLRRSCRADDFVGRLAGDEFIVITGTEPDVVADRIRSELAMPLQVGDATLSAQASIGITRATAHDSAVTLLGRADAAMYEAKRSRGRRQVA